MIPYEGTEPYIFVSYAHGDAAEVLPTVRALASRGFRVWYDEGIEAGSEYPAYIQSHLKGCAAVVAFLSPTFVTRKFCRREIHTADAYDKPILCAVLEKCELEDGLEILLGNSQFLFRDRHATQESFVQALETARILAPCRGTAVAPTVDPEVLTRQGDAYYYGHGVPQDYAKAAELYRSAADRGQINAQCNLALCYHNGLGVPQDDAKAVEYYTRAANLGYAAAQSNLGDYYAYGWGVPVDLGRSAAYFALAASQGHLWSQFRLGQYYRDGKGVPQNLFLARYWLTLAAEQGFGEAQKALESL